MKTSIEPGKIYTIDDFADSIKLVKGAKKRFLKDNENGYFSSATNTFITPEMVNELIEIVGDRESIYKYFNTRYTPFDIILQEIGSDTEKIDSNNIYDLMHAKTITHYKGSFKVKITYNEPPITVIGNEFSKNTTLGWKEINSFL